MIRFSIPDMTCGGCVKAVTGAVRGVDASAEIAADLDSKQVEIRSARPEAAIAEAIRDAGFTVEQAA